MIRNLLATTALVTFVAVGAYGQEQPAPPPAPSDTTQPAAPAAEPPKAVEAEGYLASNYLGESVYNGTGDSAENIGDVNDIVIGSKGEVQSVVIGVGGFLGIGEKSVAIEFPKLSWMEANGDRWLVTDASKEQLEALPDFDRSPYEPATPPTASIGTETAPAATTPPATPAPADTAQ